MSNIYFVTLSYNPESTAMYRPCLEKISADPKNTKILYCKQMGTKTGTHEHYHLLIETDTDVIQKFRMRFRTYMSPLKPTKRNLDIQTATTPGCCLNYWARDSTSVITNSIGPKAWDMEALKKQAVALPDPGEVKPELPWSQVYRKLIAVGWKYPERPGKYLKKLADDWHMYHIITNPKRLSLILRFEGNADDWDDCFVTSDNSNKGF